jgi:hypothetical protein
MTNQIKLQKHAKGPRPYFFDDPSVDKLLAMLLALCGEVSVVKDQLDTLERLIDEKGMITHDEIDRYQPTKAVLAEREERREQYLNQILRIIDIDTANMGRNDVSPEWQRIIKSVIEPI